MRKLFIPFLIIATLLTGLCAVPAYAGTAPTVAVTNVTGETGTTVDIPITLSNNTGFSNLAIAIEYDNCAMKLINAVANASTGATFTSAQDYMVIPYNMSWDSAANTTFNGTLVTLTFEIFATENRDYPVMIDYYKGRDGNYVDGDNVNYDENFEPLGLCYTSGAVTVTGNDEPVGDRPTVTVESASGKKGDTVSVPVNLSNNVGFSNLGIEIGYDASALTLTSAVANTSTGATYTSAQAYTVNPYNMSWDSATNVTFNGTIVTLTFEIITDKGGNYPITVDYYKGRNGTYVDGDNVNYDENFEPLSLLYVSGAVTVTGHDTPIGPTVTVGTTSGKKGDTITVPVTLSNNTGFSNLGIEIGYDASALTLTSAVENNSTGATYTSAQAYTVNPYNMSWDSATNVTFNGTIVTLTFQIITDKVGNYPITVDYYKGRNGTYVDGDNVNYDETFAPLGLCYKGGTVTIQGGTPYSITLDSELFVTLTGDMSVGQIYASLYDGNRLIDTVICDPNEFICLAFNNMKSGRTVKVMWWDDELQPLCMHQEVIIP